MNIAIPKLDETQRARLDALLVKTCEQFARGIITKQELVESVLDAYIKASVDAGQFHLVSPQ